MTDSRTWTRPRFLLALLLAALVAGAVPIRLPASRGDKAAAWRAASARPASARPDADHSGTAFLPAVAAEVLPLPRLVRVDEAPAPRTTAPTPASAGSPLPRAPPAS